MRAGFRHARDRGSNGRTLRDSCRADHLVPHVLMARAGNGGVRKGSAVFLCASICLLTSPQDRLDGSLLHTTTVKAVTVTCARLDRLFRTLRPRRMSGNVPFIDHRSTAGEAKDTATKSRAQDRRISLKHGIAPGIETDLETLAIALLARMKPAQRTSEDCVQQRQPAPSTAHRGMYW